MILANAAAAEWALQRDVPLLHRTQDIRLPMESAGVWTDPVSIFRHMREMTGAKLDVDPRRHAGLGLDRYAPITSPLRRYQDFLNVAQLESVALSGSPRWSREDLLRFLPHVNERAEAAARVQRHRTRYWKLLYFQSWCRVTNWPAVVVANDGQLVTVSLPREQIFLRAPKSLFGDKAAPGQPFQVRLGKIDPLNNEIKILSAWED
jgi:exoribonuclease-2